MMNKNDLISKIKQIPEIELIGIRTMMSLAEDKTASLWKQFMPKRKEIVNRLDSDFFDVQIYNSLNDFNDFDQYTLFEKWSAVKVSGLKSIPEGMELLIIPKGNYAVFNHIGTAKKSFDLIQYIYGTWLPESEYKPDSRPHFQIMKENYKPDDVNAQETIWVPVV
jgi:AraC family transcriptional regulator